MDPRLRIVTRLPLDELWNDRGPVEAVPVRELGEDDVRARLREGAGGVLASIGEPLRWLRGTEFFDWWKSEARPRLVAPEAESFFLEDFPDERCWSASEWRLADGSPVILFREWH